MSRPGIRNHEMEAGIASLNIPNARLTTSDSVVDLLVAVCLALAQVRGKYVFGPVRTKKTPEVDFESSLSPAKSASTKSDSSRSSGDPQFSLSGHSGSSSASNRLVYTGVYHRFVTIFVSYWTEH